MILFDKICLKDTEKEEKYKVLFEIIMHEASVGDSFVLIMLRRSCHVDAGNICSLTLEYWANSSQVQTDRNRQKQWADSFSSES